ncbi:transposable element Tcb1 transposase [Trichonephila clavipes]|nr:transposable element Tcb1 transposase [Trichonephila clavipes]
MWEAEWNEVVFTDESRICLQHHDGRIRVWRHRGEGMLNSCVMHRHTGPALGIMGLATAIFQQDNARPHVARIVQRFFVIHQIELLSCPALSPYLSSIENRWSMVAQRLTQTATPAARPDQLWHSVEAAWSAVPQEHVKIQHLKIKDKNRQCYDSHAENVVPTVLLACILNFCSCCCAVAWLALGYNKESDESLFTLFSLFLIISVASQLAYFWFVGGLPIAMDSFREEFRSKLQQRLLSMGRTDEIDFEKGLYQKPSFVLSGCDVFYFRRSSILGLVGAILTYTLLLVTS